MARRLHIEIEVPKVVSHFLGQGQTSSTDGQLVRLGLVLEFGVEKEPFRMGVRTTFSFIIRT